MMNQKQKKTFGAIICAVLAIAMILTTVIGAFVM